MAQTLVFALFAFRTRQFAIDGPDSYVCAAWKENEAWQAKTAEESQSNDTV